MGSSFGILTTCAEKHSGAETFADSLAGHLGVAATPAAVFRITEGPASCLDADTPSRAADAASALGASDVVLVDHEFRGPVGVDRAVLVAVEQLRCPVIIRLRSVARVPSRHQRKMINEVFRLGDAVVVVSGTAQLRLTAAYTVVPGTVVLISDAARPVPPVFDAPAVAGTPTVVTSATVAPNRGLETVIDAMAALRELDPRPRYVIAGPTDPAMLLREGEAYRHTLMARTIERGIAPMVRFSTALLDAPDTAHETSQVDVVVVADACREQLGSAMVVQALAAGTPVVALVTAATVGAAAAAGIDRFVSAGNPTALAHVLRVLLTEPIVVAAAAQRTIDGHEPTWARIASQYQALAAQLITLHRRYPAQDLAADIRVRAT